MVPVDRSAGSHALIDMTERARIELSKSWKGKYFNCLGYVFSVYCIYKVIMVRLRFLRFDCLFILVGVVQYHLWSNGADGPCYSRDASPGCLLRTASRYPVLVAADIVSSCWHDCVVLHSKPLVAADADFPLVCWHIFVKRDGSIHGRIDGNVFCIIGAIDSNEPPARVSVCPTQLFPRSIYLIRNSNRMIITSILGSIQFNFYHRWFDVIFLISSLLNVFFLYFTNQQSAAKGHAESSSHFGD